MIKKIDDFYFSSYNSSDGYKISQKITLIFKQKKLTNW